jgi:hypothetical protein
MFKFEFLLRDAPKRETKRSFADLLVSTRRFARNEKGSLCFLVTPGTSDWCPMHRAPDFAAVLADAGVIEITGDLGKECNDCLWFWASEYRWRLPRLGGAWNPDPPRPVAHVPPADRYSRGRDVGR